eukprot:13146496-Ditylum_brightwellii.AAC.1
MKPPLKVKSQERWVYACIFQEKCKREKSLGSKNKERKFIATSSTSKSERKSISTTTSRVPVMVASGGLFTMVAVTGIHDHNIRAMLQDEAIKVEVESESNEESDKEIGEESGEESDKESNKESVDQGYKGLVHKVDLEGECTKPIIPKLH